MGLLPHAPQGNSRRAASIHVPKEQFTRRQVQFMDDPAYRSPRGRQPARQGRRDDKQDLSSKRGVFRLNCPILRKSPVNSRSPEGGSNGGNRRAVSPLAGRRGSWGNLSEGSPMRAVGLFPRARKETPRGERSRGGDEEMRCRQSCNSLHSFRLRRAAANPPPSGRESERCLSLSSLREGALDAAGTKKRAKACCRILITNPMILRFDLL